MFRDRRLSLSTVEKNCAQIRWSPSLATAASAGTTVHL
jgi:hypothetical protein